METHNIHPVTLYKDHTALSTSKDMPVKKNNTNTYTTPSEAPETEVLLMKTSPPAMPSHGGTKVAFSLEKDLNIVITTVIDPNTNKVIRQIPPEETIDRLKFLNVYNKQAVTHSAKFQPKYSSKND
ncbi:MAG: flagellar protein FlaG [Candidatus Brocadia sp.]|jgi:uncharacterized FlaG/YvyC family protein